MKGRAPLDSRPSDSVIKPAPTVADQNLSAESVSMFWRHIFNSLDLGSNEADTPPAQDLMVITGQCAAHTTR